MAEVIARVIEENGKVEGGFVELSNGETTFNGRVAAVSENEFLVDWEDGARTVENKADYELVVASTTKVAFGPCSCGSGEDRIPGTDRCPVCTISREVQDRAIALRTPAPALDGAAASVTAAENPAQPAGWAVAPVDADAYPGGELIAVEMEKRQETAEWEDAQNRAPIDGPNPAQAAGWAVPEATNAPIPGQGADGLIMAHVVADDVTGENGLVGLAKGNLRVAGRVIAADDDSFIVEWADERRTVESKADYDLIITAAEPQTSESDEVQTGNHAFREYHRMRAEGEAGYAPTLGSPGDFYLSSEPWNGPEDSTSALLDPEHKQMLAPSVAAVNKAMRELHESGRDVSRWDASDFVTHLKDRGVSMIPVSATSRRIQTLQEAEERVKSDRAEDARQGLTRTPALQ